MKNNFNKVIVWGHKLGDPVTSNTFSFIHDSWIKTFKHMGYETLWLDNSDNVSNVNFDNCLFLTEGQVDQNMPVNNSSKYVLHNCKLDKYQPIIKNCLNLQVYTKDCLSRDIQALSEPLTYYQDKANFDRPDHGCDNRTLYQTWATNLLPHEIDADYLLSYIYSLTQHNKIYWVGSVCDGHQGNLEELKALVKAASKHKVEFVHAKFTNDQQPSAIQHSAIAPAIQGAWQVEKHYVPCRVFKNISFGRMPLTNNPIIKDLFDGRVIYDSNIEALVDKGFAFEQSDDYMNIMTDLITIVKDKHTYVNRVNSILEVL